MSYVTASRDSGRHNLARAAFQYMCRVYPNIFCVCVAQKRMNRRKRCRQITTEKCLLGRMSSISSYLVLATSMFAAMLLCTRFSLYNFFLSNFYRRNTVRKRNKSHDFYHFCAHNSIAGIPYWEHFVYLFTSFAAFCSRRLINSARFSVVCVHTRPLWLGVKQNRSRCDCRCVNICNCRRLACTHAHTHTCANALDAISSSAICLDFFPFHLLIWWTTKVMWN